MLFEAKEEAHKLKIETDEYVLQPSYKAMFLFKGESLNVIHFNSTDISSTVAQDGGIAIRDGRTEVRVKLEGVYEDFLQKGFTLKGYGFAVNAVYLD